MEEVKIRIKTIADKADKIVTPEEKIVVPQRAEKLDRIVRKLITLGAALVPLFIVPLQSVPFQYGKIALIAGIALTSFVIWLIARLKDGRLALPPRFFLWSGLGIVALYFASAAVSSNVSMSIAGQGFELATFISIALFIIVGFLSSTLFETERQIGKVYAAFGIGAAVIAVYQVVRIVSSASFLSFGVLAGKTANTIGGWNDLGVYFGLAAVVLLSALQLLRLRALPRTVALGGLVVSLIALALVAFKPLWIVIGLFALLLFVYKLAYSGGEEGSMRSIPYTALSVLLVSILFTIFGSLSSIFANTVGISNIDASVTWRGTFEVAKTALLENPVFGVGPNRFLAEWQLHKPAGVNQTILWNADFNYAVGLVPTFLITLGSLGFLPWLVFLVLFAMVGFRSALSRFTDEKTKFFVFVSFFSALYLWVMAFLTVPSLSLIFLGSVFTGLSIAMFSIAGVQVPKILSLFDSSKKSFASVLLLILLLIGSITMGYLYVQKSVAALYFQKASIALNTSGNIDEALRLGRRAAAFSPSDAYYRFLSQASVLKMNQVVSQSGVPAETLRTQFQGLLADAITYAQAARDIDPTNYQNWSMLGSVYETVVPVKIPGAYESAVAAYGEALTRNPQSPLIRLAQARLEVAQGNNNRAREIIKEALALKANYTEAVFLLSQIEIAEGNVKAAIAQVEGASILSPTDPTVFFQLGILKYNQRDNRGAVAAFERAVSLNPSYANARYFLGLTYYRLDRESDAITQFEIIRDLNPGNTEVASILANLKAGKSPFAGSSTAAPETRSDLPVTETDAAPTKKR